jgi:ankyrin repeat protein
MNCIRDGINRISNIDETDACGWTVLHFMVRDCHLTLISHVIDRGANINAKSIEGITPLYVSATYGYCETLKILIESGADINIQNNNGDTPLHGASYFGNRDIVELLLEAGADRTIRNVKGQRASDVANEISYLGQIAPIEDIDKSNEIKALINNYEEIPTIKEPE